MSEDQLTVDLIAAQWRAEQDEQFDRADDDARKSLHPEWVSS